MARGTPTPDRLDSKRMNGGSRDRWSRRKGGLVIILIERAEKRETDRAGLPKRMTT